MRKLRLKQLERVDSVRSEATNYRELLASKRLVRPPAASECILLLSVKGDQVVFLYAPSTVKDHLGVVREVVFSSRLRLASGRWNPEMIAEYAEACDIDLEDIVRFRERYRRLVEETK